MVYISKIYISYSSRYNKKAVIVLICTIKSPHYKSLKPKASRSD